MDAERPVVRYDAERRNEGVRKGWTKVCQKKFVNRDAFAIMAGPDCGLDATSSGDLSAGTYYLGVASHGDYGDIGQYTVTGALAAVPEPSTLAMLLGVALVSLVCHARKRLASDLVG
jgi:hypothetical protein